MIKIKERLHYMIFYIQEMSTDCLTLLTYKPESQNFLDLVLEKP